MGLGTVLAAASTVAGLFGGKKKSQTTEQRPYLPPKYSEGYDFIYDEARDIYDKPYPSLPKRRAGNAVGDSLELRRLQQIKDQEYVNSLLSGGRQPAADTGPTISQKDVLDEIQARMAYLQGSAIRGGTMPGFNNRDPYNSFTDPTGKGRKLQLYYSLTPAQRKLMEAGRYDLLKEQGIDPFAPLEAG